PEIPALTVHPIQPRSLVRTGEVRRRTLAPRQEPFAVRAPRGLTLAPLDVKALRVLPDRLQEPIASLSLPRVLDDEKGLVDEPREQVEPLELVLPSPTDSNRGFERPAAHEHREPAQPRLLVAGQVVVAPLHRGAQGLVARQARHATAGQ